MGALVRATQSEIAQLAKDPEWWPGILARIADGESIAAVVRESVWAWGALWAWIQADDERLGQYDAALKARAQMLAFSALDEADGAAPDTVGVAKLRIDTRLKVAGKWDRGRYGESSELKHSGAIGMNLMAVLASLPRAGAEKVVEQVADNASLASAQLSGFVPSKEAAAKWIPSGAQEI